MHVTRIRISSLIVVLPLGAVDMAGVTLVVGLGVLEDETVGTLQAIRALLHAVGAVFKVAALNALVGALGKGGQEREEGRKKEREEEFSHGCIRSFRSCSFIFSLPMLYCNKFIQNEMQL